ncbi:MAG: sodium/glutamate symporter [Gammaproteobacteria bacterium]|nr:sodium/glutamate symporter [Gammaproteobacteria bacterium]
MIIELTAFHLLGLAGLGVVLGRVITRRFPALSRVNIPPSIVGGLVFALVVTGLHGRGVSVEFQTTVRDILMVTFFTTIGMNASLQLLRLGGVEVAVFLGIAVLGLLLQILWGVWTATLLGLNPLVGLIPGAISLTGGPATALAFGPVLEANGVAGASALGLGAGMFGIVIGGLLGGHIGGHLIRRHDLARPMNADAAVVVVEETDGTPPTSWMNTVVVLCIAMALGTFINTGFAAQGITLPVYIGPMICAAVIRNLDDALGGGNVTPARMDEIATIALELFIVLAMLSLRLWEIANLALPVLLILCGQIVILGALCWLLVFPVMGRNYQAAVTSTGYFGFMMGTTANAMACMGELVRKYGPSPRAFFVVTIVGALFIDFINALLITTAINLLH